MRRLCLQLTFDNKSVPMEVVILERTEGERTEGESLQLFYEVRKLFPGPMYLYSIKYKSIKITTRLLGPCVF